MGVFDISKNILLVLDFNQIFLIILLRLGDDSCRDYEISIQLSSKWCVHEACLLLSNLVEFLNNPFIFC